MKIGDLDHGYSFDRGFGFVVPEGFEITNYEDFSDRAQHRVFNDERMEKYRKEEWILESRESFPDEENAWVADGVIGLHYLASSDSHDSQEFDFFVKNNEKNSAALEAEAVSRLAGLFQDELDFAYPETVNIPYTENDGNESEVIRFIPNIVYADEFDEVSNDQEWMHETRKGLHDLYVFNYLVGANGDSTHNFAFTPSGTVIPHDYHPDIGSNVNEEQSRKMPLGVNDTEFYAAHPGRFNPLNCGISDWNTELFEEAVEVIQDLDDKEVESTLRDLSSSDRVDINGLLKSKESLDEVFAREVLWE